MGIIWLFFPPCYGLWGPSESTGYVDGNRFVGNSDSSPLWGPRDGEAVLIPLSSLEP